MDVAKYLRPTLTICSLEIKDSDTLVITVGGLNIFNYVVRLPRKEVIISVTTNNTDFQDVFEIPAYRPSPMITCMMCGGSNNQMNKIEKISRVNRVTGGEQNRRGYICIDCCTVIEDEVSEFLYEEYGHMITSELL